MYLNTYIIENVAAQYRQERQQEAATQRTLVAARKEQQDERQCHGEQAPARNLRRAWSALYSFMSSLA